MSESFEIGKKAVKNDSNHIIFEDKGDGIWIEMHSFVGLDKINVDAASVLVLGASVDWIDEEFSLTVPKKLTKAQRKKIVYTYFTSYLKKLEESQDALRNLTINSFSMWYFSKYDRRSRISMENMEVMNDIARNVLKSTRVMKET